MAWNGNYFWEYAPKVTVAARRAEAARAASKLAKAGQALMPVKIQGRTIASTFWGRAWCKHIETYSDFSNRLPRGRSYARNGALLDLQIQQGMVRALVSGSSVYKAAVEIAPLEKARWKAIIAACAGKIDSVIELLSGELSTAVMERLCHPHEGLFPSSRQLGLSCSCPDGARLCKHLAAVLYGVGARLDKEPELFFILRGVDQLDLVGEATAGALGASASASGGLQRDELSSLFGIELDDGPSVQPGPRTKAKAKAKAKAKKPRPKKRRVVRGARSP